MRRKLVRCGFVASTVLAAQGCKTAVSSQVKDETPVAADASTAVVAGTLESTTPDSAPPLNQELAFDPATEANEFSFYQDMVHIIQRTLQPKHKPPSDVPLRGFHAKHHGCVAGQMYVLETPDMSPYDKYRVQPDQLAQTGADPAFVAPTADDAHIGIFGDAYQGNHDSLPAGITKSYPILVRFSNSQSVRQADRNPDGKGMAVKVLVQTPGGDKQQDFLMSDTSTANSETTAKFMAFGLATAGIHEEMPLPTSTNGEFNQPNDEMAMFKTVVQELQIRQRNLREKFPPALTYLLEPANAPTRAAILELLKNSIENTNPAKIQYWSRTPYKLGDRAVKFTNIPRDCCDPRFGFTELAGCNAPAPTHTGLRGLLRGQWQAAKKSFSNIEMKATEEAERLTDADAFRSVLRRDATQAICYDFSYMFQVNPHVNLVENPTVQWTPAVAPPVTVAKIVIPPQTFESDAQQDMCQHVGWTPANFLPEHKPMGHMNRARMAVYQASRQNRNGGDTLPNPRDFPIVLLDKQ